MTKKLIPFILLVLSACESTSLLEDFEGRVFSAGESVVLVSEMDYPKEVDYPVVPPDHPALEVMRKRVGQIAWIKWTPVHDIAGLSGTLKAGETRSGIPYSSVKEKDKFVGLEVSFRSFMTAVHNPRSVLYTEDVKQPPYNGTNCGPYYGTVCSMTVNYALGIDRPYQTNMYDDIPYIAKVKKQDPEGICPGDILLSDGHVVLVVDVYKEEGTISGFRILESLGGTGTKKLSYDEFKERWKKDGWSVYRNLRLAENLDYSPIPYVYNDGDPISEPTYNEDICTSRGDYVSYTESEPVTLNVFNKDYDTIELLRDDMVVFSFPNDKEDLTVENLPAGSYEARLVSGTACSQSTFFEVIDTHVEVARQGHSFIVSFNSSNADPLYLVVCSKSGGRDLVADLSREDVILGKVAILLR